MNKSVLSLRWLAHQAEFVTLVLKLYYGDHLTQVEIANKLFISQAKVSNILKENDKMKRNKEEE